MTSVMNPVLTDCLLSTHQPGGDQASTEVRGQGQLGLGPVAGSVVEIGQVVGQVGDLVNGLPRLLMAISAELAVWQKAGGFEAVLGEMASSPGCEAPVGVARLALAEATTAARVLARCISDTSRVVAAITTVATHGAAGAGADVTINGSTVSE
jgi:hypothetical protein